MPDFACFIDTNYIEKKAFSFDDVAYKKLRLLAVGGQIEVLAPTIIIDEVANRAKDRFDKVLDTIQKAEKESYVFESFAPDICRNIHDLSQAANDTNSSQEARELFSQYLESCGAVFLPATEISSRQLFDSYFASNPPFGEGIKRKEFVDAGVINLLDQYQGRTGLPVHVVSSDGDYANCVNNREWLVIHESLAGMLDAILDQNGQAEALASGPVERFWVGIVQHVESYLANSISLFVDDYEGHVEVLEVAVANVGDKKFVALDGDDIGVIVNVTLNIRCYVSMADPDLTAWEKGPIVLAHRTGEINKEVEATLQLEFNLDDLGDDEDVLPTDIDVDMDKLIDVNPYELDEDPTFFE